MMSCVEAYQIIQNTLRFRTDPKVQEAARVLEELELVFSQTDKLLADKELIGICKNLAKLHFSAISPLLTLPRDTIREEYRKKTGVTLQDYICVLAYYRAARQTGELPDTDAHNSAAYNSAAHNSDAHRRIWGEA